MEAIVRPVIINKTSNAAVVNFKKTIDENHKDNQRVEILLQNAADLHVVQRADWLRSNRSLLAHQCSLCHPPFEIVKPRRVHKRSHGGSQK